MSDTTEATTTLEDLGKVIGKASTDSSFRSELLQSPLSTLKTYDVAVPSGSQVQVESNTDTVRNLVLPANPVAVSTEDQEQLSSLASSNGIPAGSSVDTQVKAVIDALNDGAVRADLLEDPTSTIEKAGIRLPSGISINVLEATDTLNYLVLAPPLTESESESASETLDEGMGPSGGGLHSNPEVAGNPLFDSITSGSFAQNLAIPGLTGNPAQVPIATPTAFVITAAALLFLPTTMPSEA